MAFGDEDLDVMLGADFGWDVTLGPDTVDGQFDSTTQQILEGGSTAVNVQDASVLVKKGALRFLAMDAAIRVRDRQTNVTTYWKVRDYPDEDASLTRVFLRKA